MAVLALGFVGTAIGGSIGGTILGVTAASIGGFIGSTIGSYIDNLLFPVKQEGPRLDDLRITTSTYGKPIPRVWGPLNRYAGNIIWTTGLLETKHVEGGKGGPSVEITTYTYRCSLAIGIAANEIRGVRRIMANGKTIFEDSGSGPPAAFYDAGGGTHSLFRTLRVYPGTLDQTPDPTIESYLGVGDTPAYIGTAYIVIEDLELADFGNRVPNLEIFVEADEQIAVGRIVREIIEACGIDPNTASTGQTESCRGFLIGGESSGTGAIQPLALVFNFDVAEMGGGLRLQRRDQAPVATIIRDHMAAHAYGEDRPEPIEWRRAPETDLPREAALTFADPERDLQQNTQSVRRSAGFSENNLSRTIAVTMTADEARACCGRMLWEAWIARQTGATKLDDRWIAIEPGRSYVMPTPAGWEPVRLIRRTRGANGVIDCEVRREQSNVYRDPTPGAAPPVPPNEVELVGDTDFMLLDSPILQDADDDTGFYFLVEGVEPGWRGATLQRSTDGTNSFSDVGPQGFETNFGICQTTLPAGPSGVWDEASVLRVALADPAAMLESLPELDVLNGGNAAWIGGEDGQNGEIIQYRTATLVSPGVYDLSGLLRGRLGTEHRIAAHGPAEIFVRLAPDRSLGRKDYGPADWNKVRDYRAVSLLQIGDDAVDRPFTNTGEGKRPLSPVGCEAQLPDADVIVTWSRRSRLRQPGIGNGPVPIGEASEAYEIDVFDGATLKRTIAASASPLTYSAALMAADGFGSGDTIRFVIYQMSDVRGRGRPGEARITLP